MTEFANLTDNIACNTLPCSFTRMSLPPQHSGLRGYAELADLGVVQDYYDVAMSGRREGRPQRNILMMARAIRKSAACWSKLGRLARSRRHRLTALQEFDHPGVRFASVQRCSTMRSTRPAFHFTQASASWLNAVGGFFTLPINRQLKCGVLKGLVELQATINRFGSAQLAAKALHLDHQPRLNHQPRQDHRRRKPWAVNVGLNLPAVVDATLGLRPCAGPA